MRAVARYANPAARVSLAVILGAAGAAAQEARIVSTVFDERAGDTVTGLRAERFQIRDGKTDLRVLSAVHPDTPVDILALVDSSIVGDLARPTAEGLVAALADGQQMAVAQFDEGATLLQDFTSDKQRLYRAIEGIEYGNLPRLNDALYAVIDGAFDTGSNRRAIIVLSGGATAASRTREAEVLQAARDRTVSIYTVFVRTAARGHLRRLALSTGGAAFAAKRLGLEPRTLAAKVLEAVHGAYELRAEGVFALGNDVSVSVLPSGGTKQRLTASALPID